MTVTKPVLFSIIGGASFRAQYYLRIAQALPDRFRVTGIVVRDRKRASEMEAKWSVAVYQKLEQLLDAESPDFVVVSVSAYSSAEILVQLAERGIPALTETPPGSSLEELNMLHAKLTLKDAKVQVAEQYFLHPMNVARLTIIESGLLGEVTQATVSISHMYHGASLIRKMLGISFEEAEITAMRFASPIIAGPSRQGRPKKEEIITEERDIAWIEFGGKLGIYDFTKDQHRSWIRSNHLSVRGTMGELFDNSLSFLQDYDNPLYLELKRVNRGEQENQEGYFLEGIVAGERWVYRNPFKPARLYDDELAVATSLQKMTEYISEGTSFYSIAEASQDHYLGLLIEQAIVTGQKVKAVRQQWAQIN